MSGSSGINFNRQFESNFDKSTIETGSQDQDDTKGTGSAKGKDGATGSTGLGATETGSSSGVTQDAFTTSGDEPVQVLVMQYMLDAYNSNTDQLMDAGNQMQASTAEASDLSAASAAITSAQLAAGTGNVTIKIVPDGSANADSNNGSTAYITQQQADEMAANGLDITSGESIDSTGLSALQSSLNDIQEQLSSNTEYLMLQVQTYTQNQSQDGQMATSTLKSVGQTETSTAQNVG